MVRKRLDTILGYKFNTTGSKDKISNDGPTRMGEEMLRQKEALKTHNNQDRFIQQAELALTGFLLRFVTQNNLSISSDDFEIIYNDLKGQVFKLLNEESTDKDILAELFDKDNIMALVVEHSDIKTDLGRAA